MGILLGLAAAFCWGTADFLVRYAASQIGPYRTLFYMQFFGLTVLTLYLVASGTLKALLSQNSWQPWAWLLLVAVINTCSSLALYRAFTIGILMIVSPITSANAAITVLLAFLSGEKVSQVRAIGMGIVLLGVVLTATVLPSFKKLQRNSKQIEKPDASASKQAKKPNASSNKQTRKLSPDNSKQTRKLSPDNSKQTRKLSPDNSKQTRKLGPDNSKQTRKLGPDNSKQTNKLSLPPGTGIALLAALGYGTSFWLLGFQVTPHLGGVAPTWVARIVTPLLLFSFAPLLKQPMQIPSSRVIWGYLTAISILDTAAFVFFGLGLVQSQISLVSVLASLYGAVTVLLAFFFLHERLHWNQWIGITIIFIGVALVNV